MAKSKGLTEPILGLSGPRRNEPSGVVIKNKIDLARFLPFRFHRLSVQLAHEGSGTNSISDNLKRSGAQITIRDWRLMMLLANFGPLTNAEIVVFANMNAATISRALANLADAKMVVSKTAPDDGRKVIYALTQKGAELYNAIAPLRIEQSERVESVLTKSERETLYKILDKLERRVSAVENINNATDIEWSNTL